VGDFRRQNMAVSRRRGANARRTHFDVLLAALLAWLRKRSEWRSSRAFAGLLRQVRANRSYLSASAVFTSTMFFVCDFLVIDSTPFNVRICVLSIISLGVYLY